jgi:carboxypeptidase family protein
MLRRVLRQYLTTTLLIAFTVFTALGQQSRASLRGLVSDERSARIVGASVTLTDSNGQTKATLSNDEGIYVFNGLAPGKYTIRASATTFATSSDVQIELKAGPPQSLDLILNATIEEQRVTVAADTSLSTDATANANQLVLAGKDLDALPDDPDELGAALRALAGPSLGPDGGQIFIDGFSGGTLPPKSSIREVRVNQNPFAAENDQMTGRIDVFTRPGTDKLRASAFMTFNDESLNSRNPFAAHRTAFSVRQFGGNLSGRLVANKASFIVDFERREVNDNELVNATVLDANLNRLSIAEGVLTPRRFMNFTPRVDYALNESNTLVVRYSYNHSNLQNNGVGNFSLPQRAYDSLFTSNNLQITETAVINPTTINETRFQFTHSRTEQLGDSSTPTLVVSGSFIGGGSQVGQSVNTDQRWELSNFTAIQKGQHTYKVGARLRHVNIVSINNSNFGGQYLFTGALVPQLDANGEIIPNTLPIPVDSLERYRRNLILNPRTLLSVSDPRHLTPVDVRARGGGAAQFAINSGNPEASVSQFDFSLYGQDDWRIRSNLTFSYGLRYEYQSNIDSPLNLAPRIAVAWSPGTPSRGRPPKMVIRAGLGIFYVRFNETSTLQANRFSGDGNGQQQFVVKENLLFDSNGQPVPQVPSPLDAFPNVPSLAGVSTQSQQITWRVAPTLQSLVAYGLGAQIERQLPHKITMFTGVFLFKGQHLFRVRDINAPLPGTITSTDVTGVRPFGDVGHIYQYESSGKMNQNQIFVGLNSRFSQSISFFGNYSLVHNNSDTEGQGARSFPVDSHDLRGEYGRASIDIRHRFTFGGTWTLPWWGLSLNPFILASTGAPFNIITGVDTNLDGQFMERPSFAPAGVACDGPGKPIDVVCTQAGNFNVKPAPGEQLIPRNYGQSPGYFVVNLSASKTISFGSIHSGNKAAKASSGASAGTQTKPGAGIPGVGPGGLGSSEVKRYSMQFSINVQNLFNRVNFQPPEGNLSSPSFGQSLGLNGFGGFSAPGSSGAGNRRIIARVRFSF